MTDGPNDDGGSFVRPVLSATLEEAVAKQNAKWPPSGLSPVELRTWIENEEDERMFGEGT